MTNEEKITSVLGRLPVLEERRSRIGDRANRIAVVFEWSVFNERPGNTIPVTNWDAADASHTAAPTRSPGSPILPMGVCATTVSPLSVSPPDSLSYNRYRF